jgi:hypothetical protein
MLNADDRTNHFSLDYVGNPYLPMNIYLTNVTLDNATIGAGDELAVFDGNYCVGKLDLNANPTYPLSLTASTDDSGTPQIDGFTEGNAISIRYWDESTSTEITDFNLALVSGNLIFSSLGTTAFTITENSQQGNQAPTADAGNSQVVNGGDLVTLNGGNSSDPEGEDISYQWTAPEGITLSNPTTATPSFTAPTVNETTSYNFTLTVSDGELTDSDNVTITVNGTVSETHFDPIYTGNPYQPINIFVLGAKISNVNMEAGDEIGIFDNGNCVGVGVLTEEITNTFSIVASADDPTTNELDGFTNGNEIQYKLFDVSENEEYEYEQISVEQLQGDGNFEPNGTEVVRLNVTENVAPVIEDIDDQAILEDTEFQFLVLFTDANADDTHTIRVISDNPNVLVSNPTSNESGASVILDPNDNYFGTANIHVYVEDQGNLSDHISFQLAVASVNDAPQISQQQNLTASEDDVLTIDLDITDPDADIVPTYEIVFDQAGFSAVSVVQSIDNLVFEVHPPSEFHNTVEVEVFATDQYSSTSSMTFEITYTERNDAPVLTDQTNKSFNEDTILNVQNSFDDEDDNSGFTFDITSNNPNLTVSQPIVDLFNKNINYNITPDANYFGEAVITEKITDDDGATDSVSYNVTILPVNDNPLINPVADQNMFEDSLHSFIINFSDIELDDTHTLEISSEIADVDFDYNNPFNSGDEVEVILPNNYNGSFEIVTSISDGVGATADTITFNVAPVNDAPEILLPNQISFKNDENYDIDLTDIIFDIDSDSLNITITGNTEVQYDLDYPNIRFSSSNDFVGFEFLTITADDEELTSEHVLRVDVEPANQYPIVNIPATMSFNEDTIYRVDFADYLSDPENDPLTIELTTTDIHIAQGQLIADFSADLNWNGSETVNYIVSDGYTDVTGSFVMTVNPVNDDPEIDFTGTIVGIEDQQFILDLDTLFTDVDGDDLSYSVTQYDNFNVAQIGSMIQVTPHADWFGTSSIHIIADDNVNRLRNQSSRTARATVEFDLEIEITPINDAPRVTNPIPDIFFDEDNTFNLNIENVFTDPENNDIALSVDISDNMNAELTGNYVILTPDTNWSGTAELMITAQDLYGAFAIDTVNITVNNVNDAPMLVLDDELIFDEDSQNVELDLSGSISDIDNSIAQLNLFISSSNNITATVIGTSIFFTPDANWAGEQNYTVTLSDGSLSVTDNILVTVNQINDAPFVTQALPNVTTDEETSVELVNLNSYFSDLDLIYGDVLTYSILENENFEVEFHDTGLVTITPAEDWYGVDDIVFVATDQGDESVQQELTVFVNNVNDPPVVDFPSLITFNEDENYTLLDWMQYVDDVEQGASGIELTFNGAEHVNITIDGDNIEIDADQDWFGSESVFFSVNDNQGRAVTSDLVQFNVLPIQDFPAVVWDDPQISTFEDSIYVIPVDSIFVDVDGDELEITYTETDSLTVTVADNQINVQPLLNWSGTESVTFTASDEFASISETLTFTFVAVNDAPQADFPAELTFNEDTSEEFDFSEYITDVDSPFENLQLAVIDDDTLDVTIDGFNVTVSSQIENWNGLDTLRFTCNDMEDGLRAVGAFDVVFRVLPINDAPVFGAMPNYTEMEDFDTLSIDLTQFVSDVDMDELEFSAQYNNSNIQVSFDGYDMIITSIENWNGTTDVTVIADDMNNASRNRRSISRDQASQSFSITVIPVNDSPVVTSYTPEADTVYITNSTYQVFEIIAQDIDSSIDYTWLLDNEDQNEDNNTLVVQINENGTYELKCLVEDEIHSIEVSWTLIVDYTGLDDVNSFETELGSISPNPFNPTAKIAFTLAKKADVKIKIYNAKGQLIKTLVNKEMSAGAHNVIWNGKNSKNNDAASGVYFIRMNTNDSQHIKKALLLK